MKKFKQRVLETSFLAALLMLFYMMMINTANGQFKQVHYGLDLAITNPEGLSFMTTSKSNTTFKFASDAGPIIYDQLSDTGYSRFLLNFSENERTIGSNIPEGVQQKVRNRKNRKLLAPLIKIPFKKNNK